MDWALLKTYAGQALEIAGFIGIGCVIVMVGLLVIAAFKKDRSPRAARIPQCKNRSCRYWREEEDNHCAMFTNWGLENGQCKSFMTGEGQK